MTARFRVHLAQLSDVIEQIDRFDKHLEAALEQADARVNRLHATWSGQAAQAHRAAHDKWKHGAEQMRAALAVMRQNAAAAHGNYSDAVKANTSMWGQAR